MNRIYAAAVLLLSGISCQAQGTEPEGTICFTREIRSTEADAINCRGLGKFASIADIYAKRYRVVSTGVVQDVGTGTVFIVIEKRRGDER